MRSKRNSFFLAFTLVALVLICDQMLKFWVKNHMYLGQEIKMIGNWFILHYTENNGMAFGLELGGDAGKLFLTGFRILAVFGILYYLIYQIRHQAKTGLIVCISLVLAGAIGNIIDSVFYGVWFNDHYNEYLADGTLKWKDHAPLLFGRVVDMLYFPLIEGHYPSWIPSLGGEPFMFFRPVFNLADASISTGVFSILIFQKRLFPSEKSENIASDAEEAEENSSESENADEVVDQNPDEDAGDSSEPTLHPEP